MRWQLQDPNWRGMFVLGVAKGLQVMEDLPRKLPQKRERQQRKTEAPYMGERFLILSKVPANLDGRHLL